MTLLLSNEDVDKALNHADALSATEAILGELAQGQAINRPRSQTYMPVESKENPGFKYRFKSQEGGGVGSGVWALRITSDMAGFSYTNGVKRRRRRAGARTAPRRSRLRGRGAGQRVR